MSVKTARHPVQACGFDHRRSRPTHFASLASGTSSDELHAAPVRRGQRILQRTHVRSLASRTCSGSSIPSKLASRRIDLAAVVARDEHVRAEEAAAIQEWSSGFHCRIQLCNRLVQAEARWNCFFTAGSKSPFWFLSAPEMMQALLYLRIGRLMYTRPNAMEGSSSVAELPCDRRALRLRRQIDEGYVQFLSKPGESGDVGSSRPGRGPRRRLRPGRCRDRRGAPGAPQRAPERVRET